MQLLFTFAILCLGWLITSADSLAVKSRDLVTRATEVVDDGVTTRILYSPSGWTHAKNQDASKVYGGTESYSHAPDAAYVFFINGHTKLKIWGGKKIDRGYFDVYYVIWTGVRYKLGRVDAHSTARTTGVCKSELLFSFDIDAHGYSRAGVVIVNNYPNDARFNGEVPWLQIDRVVLT